MATVIYTWTAAVDAFVTELAQFRRHRRDGLDVAEAGALLGVSTETAQAYEAALFTLIGDRP